MLVPMLFGYVVGAVGIYTLLYKLSPIVAEDYSARGIAPSVDGCVEIIELFPADSVGDQRKVA